MEGRRRVTLFDQMTAGDNTVSSRDSLAGLILNDNDVVLTNQKNEATGNRQSRTLQDIIREDAQAHHNNNTRDRNSWKAFKDMLRLKLTVSSTSTVSNSGESTQHHDSVPLQQQQNDVVQIPTESDVAAAGQVSASLMDLLEETDGEMGFQVSRYGMSDDDDVADDEHRDDVDDDEHRDDVDDDDGDKEGEVGVVVENNCCVCMVRHKGAAFIPCGHTFCRVCSRELWVSRGNCPLCNNFILEILDIF